MRDNERLKKGFYDAYWKGKRMKRGEGKLGDYKLGVLIGMDAVKFFGRNMVVYQFLHIIKPLK